MDLNEKFFAPGVRYKDLNLENIEDLAGKFVKRMDEWFLKPIEVIKSPDSGFVYFNAANSVLEQMQKMCMASGGNFYYTECAPEIDSFGILGDSYVVGSSEYMEYIDGLFYTLETLKLPLNYGLIGDVKVVEEINGDYYINPFGYFNVVRLSLYRWLKKIESRDKLYIRRFKYMFRKWFNEIDTSCWGELEY